MNGLIPNTKMPRHLAAPGAGIRHKSVAYCGVVVTVVLVVSVVRGAVRTVVVRFTGARRTVVARAVRTGAATDLVVSVVTVVAGAGAAA